jgi:SAM-dependent methyltransferase
MNPPRHTQGWNDLAGLDPMWAVLSEPGKRYGKWDEAEFFRTGKEEIDQLHRFLVTLGFTRDFASSLDFGCGLGRLTVALRQFSGEAIGVDISPDMIERARSINPTCQFIHNPYYDLRIFPAERFDLIYSRRVLQHQPSAAAVLRYVSEFVRILKPGGVAAFQVPARIPLRNRIQPKRRIYALLRTVGIAPHILYRLGLHPMSMVAASADAVEATIRAAKGRVLSVELDYVSCPGVSSNFFYVSK